MHTLYNMSSEKSSAILNLYVLDENIFNHYLTCLPNSVTFIFFLTLHFSSHIFMYTLEASTSKVIICSILCNICIFVTKTWHVLIIHLLTFTFFQTWHFSSHIFIYTLKASKVHIFWEGHKILWNLHLSFDWHYIGQKYGEYFAKFCGLLRIYELYIQGHSMQYLLFWYKNCNRCYLIYI